MAAGNGKLGPRKGAGSNKSRGILTESRVRDYLLRQGWEILMSNYRCSFGEIDIVAREITSQGPVLAFIEVKARTTNHFGSPLSSITPAKQSKLAACASCFLGEHSQGDQEPQCRFDAAVVYLRTDGQPQEITIYRGIFTL